MAEQESQEAARRRLEIDDRVTPAQSRALVDAAVKVIKAKTGRLTIDEICRQAYDWIYK